MFSDLPHGTHQQQLWLKPLHPSFFPLTHDRCVLLQMIHYIMTSLRVTVHFVNQRKRCLK